MNRMIISSIRSVPSILFRLRLREEGRERGGGREKEEIVRRREGERDILDR